MTHGPIQTVVRRMAALRDKRMTGEQLAAAMREHGIPWKRDVVANLEGGRRNRLDVDELLALALVFGVPPISLLVDPTSETTTVTTGSDGHPPVEVPTAQALMWLAADNPLEDVDEGSDRARAWATGRAPLVLLRRFDEAVAVLNIDGSRYMAARQGNDDAATEETRGLFVARLRALSEVMFLLGEARVPVPEIGGRESLDAMAAEHGVTLGITRDEGAPMPGYRLSFLGSGVVQ